MITGKLRPYFLIKWSKPVLVSYCQTICFAFIVICDKLLLSLSSIILAATSDCYHIMDNYSEMVAFLFLPCVVVVYLVDISVCSLLQWFAELLRLEMEVCSPNSKMHISVISQISLVTLVTNTFSIELSYAYEWHV